MRIPRLLVPLAVAALAVAVAPPLRAHEAKEVAPEFLGYYLKMQAALAGDSAAGVAETASTIVTEAMSYANHSPDKKLYEALAAAARQVDGKDLAALRGQFKTLSRAMDAFLRAAGHPPAGGEWQLFHCPMADGYWIQSDAEVRNPYYGKAMLRCGDVVDRVKEG